MILRAIALAIILTLASPARAETRLYFSPATNLAAIDRAALDGARATIDLAAYALTDPSIIAALARAARRGVRVRIVLDPRQRLDRVMDALAGAPGVALRIKGGGALMHLKVYVVDGALARHGAANFSKSGLRRQNNDLTLDDTPAMVAACEAIVAYRENPHVDMRQRGVEAAEILVKMLTQGVKPTMRAYLPSAYGAVTGEVQWVNPEDVSKAMERYVFDDDTRKLHARLGKEKTAEFTWSGVTSVLVKRLRAVQDEDD